MRTEEIKQMVSSTSDAAFAVDAEGSVVAWNPAAESLFALPTAGAIGRPCRDIVQGTDECGAVCSQECTVRQAVQNRHPISNFDLQMNTATGRQWCNVSVLVAENGVSTNPHAIHVIRPIDLRKRLEILVRDFVVSSTSVTPESAVAMIASTRTPARDTQLSARELEILRLLARGESSKTASDRLHISRTTVNNHVQHILHKLGVHNRLEAIRRAEHAGLI